MCGIVGFMGKDEVVYDLMIGLTALQHRGQDSAGIVTFKETFHTKKGLGLVNNIFRPKHFSRLKGKIGVGHVRYTTQGGNEVTNVQPISTNYPFGIAMVHNGNVTNFDKLRKSLYDEYHTLPATTSDLELILYHFAAELGQKDLASLQVSDLFDAVVRTQEKVEGAYSTIAVIANHGLLAFCDPNGIRPLILGKKETKKGTVYGFASESTCFDHIGYEVVDDLKAGEIVFIDKNHKVHRQIGYQKETNFCVFEYIYFARDDSIIQDTWVAGTRVKMGRQLAKKVIEKGLKPDMVIDVPSTGYYAASGLAEALGIPYRRGLMKNNHIGRSFISPDKKVRKDIVKRKLNPLKKVVQGKKVAVVDDSIVRGTTSKRIVKMLRDSGAAEVYFISAAPPIKHPCVYGIDMSETTELIAANKTMEGIRKYMKADALIYQELSDLEEIFSGRNLCTACLSGKYPTEGIEEAIELVASERKLSKSC